MPEPTRRLPAEWEPQDAVLLAWPHPDSDWRPILEEITNVYLEIVRRITVFERVLIAVAEPGTVQERLARAGINLSQVVLIQVPTNDSWARDFGPITVFHKNRPLLLDFGFNGWGLKFASNQDNQVTRRLHQARAFGSTPLETVAMILEGGSIESDGQGTLLTTSACLLNANRNPQHSRQQLEQALRQHLGGRKIHWLDHGALAGDDTDAHIDTLARLAPDRTILYVSCDDPGDEHYPELQRMEQQLKQLQNQQEQAYRLIPLPWPQACYDEQGQRLPATYANFLVINRAVLVPTYADPADNQALAAIAQAFPGRQVIGINCRPVICQHGSLHCLTMQIPQGVLP